MTRSNLTDEELIGYFEGALTPDEIREIEALLASDPEARARLDLWARQNDDIRAAFPDQSLGPVPDRLHEALRAAPSASTSAAGAARPLRRIAAAAALVALGGIGGWTGRAALTAPAPAERLAEAAISAHDTFVVEVKHPVEVTADQREHMDAWMSNRMGTAMRPPDLTTAGYRLMGGRILPAGDRPASLYMYENADGQRITLYIAHQPGDAASAFLFSGSGRTQSLEWSDGGLGYALVGSVPRERLREVAEDVYDQLL